MVVIGRVGPPRVSHFDGAIGKWGHDLEVPFRGRQLPRATMSEGTKN